MRAAWPALQRFPHAHGALLEALTATLTPHEIVVLRGPHADLEAWREFVDAGFNPGRLTFAIDASETALPGLLAERAAVGERTIAYVCQGTTCRAPVDSLETLTRELGAATKPAQ